MKVDKTKIRYTTELPPDCKVVIERLKKSNRTELVQYLREFQLWNLSKSELAYWSTVLDMFDGILEECSLPVKSNAWCLYCDKPENAELRETACCILNFMALLIEHTFGRHIFSSIDRIILLLNTSDVSLLNATLSLLYSFSKRSSFIQRLDGEVHGVLMKKMMSIAESWGERENGFSLADCCRHISPQSFPRNPLSFSFEYYFIPEHADTTSKSKKSVAPSQLACLRCDLSDEPYVNCSTGEIMIKLLNDHRIPDTRHQQLFHRLRLARGFADYSTRLQLIESRLLTLTTLIYCRTISSSAITTTFIEEVAELLQLSSSVIGKEYTSRLSQLKGAALKLLTALVHAELNGYKKLSIIVDCLGVNDYHGFLPSLFRQTVQGLLEDNKNSAVGELTKPNGFTTCIFSLLYHMATIEPTGSGALLAAGLVEPLLKVVGWYSQTEENLAYVTRAVRVVNLICDYDATSFFQLGGLGICVQRLEHDVEVCRREEPYEIQAEWLQLYMDPPQGPEQQEAAVSTDTASGSAASPGRMEIVPAPGAVKPDSAPQKSVECSQQRMALLKSLLGFFKDLFANQTHADQIRRVMDAAVPRCLRHIISNPQYYGPTVFLNAVDLVTRYIYQEPSLLSQLQDSGFTNVVLYALIIRNVPATREVLAQLPAAFSALCLNQRGLQTFIRCQPFDRLMKFLFSPEYLPAMQRRTGGKDAGGNSDTARSLGLAVDDMMRHQPALRPDTMRALVKLLEQLGTMGRDKSSAWAGVATADSNVTPTGNSESTFQQGADDGGSTSDDDEDGANLPLQVVGVGVGSNNQNPPTSAAPATVATNAASTSTPTVPTGPEPPRRKPPVTEFIYNTMRFMEAMLSSNATDDHCTAFANQGGVKPLLSLLTLPHLPLDFAGYHACDSIAAVVKSMTGLSRNGQLVTKAFELLAEQLHLPILENFSTNSLQQTSSNLWAEASKARSEEDLADPAFAPLIRALSAVHAILSMLFHLSSNQQEVRTVLLTSWASSDGLSILAQLTQLYTALMWEFSLLVIESDNIVAAEQQAQSASSVGDSDKMETTGSNGSTVPADSQATSIIPVAALNLPPSDRVRIYKFVAGLVADQLKTFHQLFIHLVRLAAATPTRRTRLGMMVPPVNPASQFLAAACCRAIHAALSAGLPANADTRAKLKYYQISAGTLTWLYDDNNQPYHILLSYFAPVGCRDALKSVIEYLLTLDPSMTLSQAAASQTTPGSSGVANVRPSLPTMMAISVDSTLSDLLTELRRLCSTAVIVDSPNSLQASGVSGAAFLSGVNPVTQRSGGSGFDFDPNVFVANMQSVAFSLLQQAWSSTTRRMSSSPVSPLFVDIMCHVVGSPQLTERNGTDEEKPNGQQPSTSSSSAASAIPTAASNVASGLSFASAAANSAALNSAAPNLASVIREAAAAALEPPVSAEHLQQLIDMGFPRELAIDALLNSTNLEQAADYCLTHPAPPPAAPVPAAVAPPVPVAHASEGGQAVAAAAAANQPSLARATVGGGADFLNYMIMNMPHLPRSQFPSGQPIPSLSQPSASETNGDGSSMGSETSSKQNGDLIDPADVSSFLIKIFKDLLALIESNQLIVPKVAALLSSAIRAKQAINGSSLFAMLLESTIEMIDDPTLLTSQDGRKRLAARLYLSSLLLTGVKVLIDCSLARSLANRLVALLANAEFDPSVKQLPVWIAPAVCYIDVYIESAVGSYLRAFTLRAIEKPHRWQWYKSEDRQPKWIDYSTADCRMLDAAYKRGLPTVRLYVNSRAVVGAPPQAGGRRSYTVDLRKMRQVADDSGTGRRIRIATSSGKPVSPSAETPTTSEMTTMEVDEASSLGGPAREFDFAINEKYRLVEFCVRMLGLEDLEGNSHQAVLLLLARLTSEAALCSHFVICGGLRALLQLPATPTILSLSSVVMLVLRHVLEDTTTIRAMMERLCRTLVGQPTDRDREREMMLGHMTNGQGAQGQAGSKEFHYFVQLMAPLICKNMDLWQEVCESVVRLQPPPTNKTDDDERTGTTAVYCRLAAHLQQTVNNHAGTTANNSVAQPVAPQSATKATQQTPQQGSNAAGTAVNNLSTVHPQPTLNESATSMVRMLLALVCQNEEDEVDEEPSVKPQQQQPPQQPAQQPPQQQTEEKEERPQGSTVTVAPEPEKASTPAKRTKLFSRNFVLRALAELVRASPPVSLAVVQYQHHPILMSATDSQENAPTALSLIFDELLTRPAVSNAASRLVAALAACYQCPDAQAGLIGEAKLALSRALAQPESPAKHRHLRCLAEVVQLMIQVCPSQQQTPLPSNLIGRPSEKLQQMNNIIRLMYKRGLLSDLAKASHSLDLSSPDLSGTVNALLGPLDTLCRAVNSQHLQQQLQSQQAQRSGANATAASNNRTEQPATAHSQRQHRTAAEVTTTATTGTARQQTASTGAAGANANSIAQASTTSSGAPALNGQGLSAASAASTGQSGQGSQAEGFGTGAELEESLGPESMPADEPTMEHILERLLNDNHAPDLQDLLGAASVGGAAHGRRRHHRQLVVLEDMSSDDEGDDDGAEEGEEEEEEEEEDDHVANITVNLDGTMAEAGADDSQVRESGDGGARANADQAAGRMEVGEVDDDFETADDDDNEDEDGEMGEDDEDEDEEGVMEEDEDDEDDEDYGDDQESGATEAISDEAGDHIHGFIPGDIDLMLGALPADDTPTLPSAAANGAAAAAAAAALPSAIGGTVFAHPLLSRAAIAPTAQHRSNLANAIAGNAGAVGNWFTGGAGGQFRQPRGIGFFPRQRQNAGAAAGAGIQAMVFEELNADFFRHVFGDLLGGEDTDYRTGLGVGHFDQIFTDAANRRHGLFLGGGAGGRARGDGFLHQDGIPSVEWRAVGGMDVNGRMDSPSAVIADVPSTLQRWSEEARLLYGNNVHDLVLAADRRLYGALCRVREREMREQQQQQQQLQQQQQQQAQQQPQQPQPPQPSAAATASSLSSVAASALAAVGFSLGGAMGFAEEAAAASSRGRAADPHGDQRSARTNPPGDRMEAIAESTRAIETPVIVHPRNADLIRGAVGLSVDEMQTLASLMTFGDSSTTTSSSGSARNSDSMGARADSNTDQPMEAEAAQSSQPTGLTESVSPSRQMEVSIPTPQQVSGASASSPPLESGAGASSPSMASSMPVSSSSAPTSNASEITTQQAIPEDTVVSVAAALSGPTDLSLAGNNRAAASSSAPVATQAASGSATSGAAAAADSGMPVGLEGIDPSFLEALPDNIRQEVIAEQIRLQSMRRQLQESRDVLQRLGIPQDQVAEISPEFLAALPPQIQEEIVAAQQAERSRLLDEQQRAAAGTSAAGATGATGAAAPSTAAVPGTSSGTSDGIDPATFLATLPANLRQQVLADMDDSLVNILPQDLAAEARRLRQEAEERQARVLQQRLNDFPASLDFVYGLRPPGVGRGRFAAFRTSLPIGRAGRPFAVQLRDPVAEARAAAAESAVRQLLDHEGLSCLVILLFVTESRTYAARLKSLLLCLCQHKPTRVWIIDTLISILRRAADTLNTAEQTKIGSEAIGWLNIGMESALGGRTRVFQMPQQTGKRASSHATIGIHPQAATTVCRQALDILQALAKNFPSQFVQPMSNPVVTDSSGALQQPQQHPEPDFWEVLLKLDNPQAALAPNATPSTPSKRSRLRGGISESGQSGSSPTIFGVASTPQAALMALLGGVNIKKSQQLTDKVLALMNMVAQLPNLPALITECQKAADAKELPVKTTSSATAEEISQQQSDQPIIPKLLPLVINAMIGKACSEEGLEDATSLLGHLSLVNKATCELVKQLLTGAARDIGRVVSSNVRSLLSDIDRVCPPPVETTPPTGASSEGDASANAGIQVAGGSAHVAGRLTDRYTGNEVIVSAPKKAVILPADLQLPSVSMFTSRTSSQRYLLRILKAIRQLQEQHQARTAPTPLIQGNAAVGANPTNPTNPAAATAAVRQNSIAPMAIADQASSSSVAVPSDVMLLAEQLGLEDLWLALSDCLTRLEQSADPQAVLLLQPAVEAFFIVHSKPPEKPPVTAPAAGARAAAQANQLQQQQQQQAQPPPTQYIVQPEPFSPAVTPLTPSQPQLPPEQQLFVHFAEKHRVVLNQILRQSTQPLSEGPFAVLTNYTRILDFDVKRRYFRQELERVDEGRRRDDLAVHVRRQQVFEDSYRELHRRLPEEWKARFFVIFDGEEGQDAGGLLREWFVILSREIFNPHYALFRTSPGDRVTYGINELSSCHLEHLSYFKFVGQLIAKAIYENKLLDCYFTRSFYKHILGIPVKYTDMESEDYTLYRNLVYLLEHNAADLGLDLTFSTEIPEFGVMRIRDLKPNGRNIPVTEENKREYVQLLCQMKMTGAIEQQLESFLDGFYSIIPRRLISIFNEQELELLVCGLPTVDIEDLRTNTEYHKYQPQSLQIQWLWRALRSFSDAERARFMQFVTGTSKVPLGGFANLEGMHGAQKFQIHRDDRSTERLPTAHTCFNQLDLPPYETYDKLREMLLIAITEGSEGFGFA